MDFFTLPRQTYEVSRHGWLLMTCEVWRLLRLEVIEAATMFTSCLDVQWWWSSGCAGLKTIGARGFKCHVTLPYVEIPRKQRANHFFLQRCKLKKKPGKLLRRGNRVGAQRVEFPMAIFPWLSWQTGDLRTLRHVERWRRRWKTPVVEILLTWLGGFRECKWKKCWSKQQISRL